MPEARHRLLTPGPTPVPAEVLAAMSVPIIHHRTPAFRRMLARLLAHLKEIFRTENEIALFTSSGSGGMESAVANLCSPGDRVLVASAGNFGERWAAIAKAYGCDLVHLRYSWGESPSADDVASMLAERGGAKAVFLTHCETSTGVVSDIRSLAAPAAESGALVAVDAISSLAAVPLEADAWGLDVVVGGSQKALMTPPGLALTSASPAARAAAREGANPRFYFNWERTFESQAEEPPVNPFTPAISLVLGLDAAVSLILDEGLEAVFDRHVRLGRACRAGVKAMGLELFSPDEDRSAVVTAIRMPADIDAGEVIRTIGERHGITLEGGRGELVGRIVRIGHIGYVDVFDVTTALAALELVLADLGADIERGAAVPAAHEAYAEPARV